MSNHLSIAATTATLCKLLQDAINRDDQGIGAVVSTLRPGELGSNGLKTGVNVYLYQALPNAALRNEHIPHRQRADKTFYWRPRVALDLHYLLTFYGDETELVPQRLLGSVVRALETTPVLTRAGILQAVEDPAYTYLAGADLQEAEALVKFSPLSLNLEELSKLWSVFFQTAYSLSAAYQASVVLVDADQTSEIGTIAGRTVAVGTLGGGNGGSGP